MAPKHRSLLAALALFAVISLPAARATDDETVYAERRNDMVRSQIERRGVSTPEVLRAMRTVPRHLFVPPDVRDQAYRDNPLPIGYGQTISQPYVVALMTEALDLKRGDRVLEIGTGSGYQAAVLSEILDGEVYSIEIIPPLSESAKRNLAESGYDDVAVKTADGYYGWPEKGPFDAVIITAAANHIPPPLIDQLKVGGRLILPLGQTVYVQVLTLLTKSEDGVEVIQMGGVRFVPMVGEVQKPRPESDAPR